MFKGKMFFYMVLFPSAVDVFLGCPEAGSLIFILHMRPPEDMSLDLQSRAESKREWDGGGREKETLTCCGTPAAPHTRTPCNSLASELPWETRKRAQWMLPCG